MRPCITQGLFCMYYSHIFNPTCELAVSNGTVHYMPPLKLKVFEDDLSVLPAYYTDIDDSVYLSKLPDASFVQFIHTLGLSVGFNNRIPKANLLNPWGWAPNLAKYSSSPLCNNSVNILNRKRSVELLSYCKSCFTEKELMHVLVPKYAQSIEDVEIALNEWNSIVVKSIHSSSGRGVVFLEGEIALTQKQKIIGAIRSDGAVIIEKMYRRIQDYSLQFEKSGSVVDFLGISKLQVTEKGDYIGNELNSDYPALFEGFIKKVVKVYCKFFTENLYLKEYSGPIGVDVFVFEQGGDIFFHPAVEVNYRHTMGYVAKKLERFVNHNSKATFQVQRVNDSIRRACVNNPIVDNGTIVSKYTVLTPIYANTKFCATLNITAE